MLLFNLFYDYNNCTNIRINSKNSYLFFFKLRVLKIINIFLRLFAIHGLNIFFYQIIFCLPRAFCSIYNFNLIKLDGTWINIL